MRVTEKENIELLNTKKALEECREQLHLLTEQSLLAIAIIQNNRVVYANRAYAQLTGYPLTEILGWTMADTIKLIRPDYRDFAVCQGEKKMAGDTDSVVTNYLGSV